jgi:hypothetical protein
MIRAGDRITIHAAKSWADDAIVLSVTTPDELPAIDGAPNVEAVRAILAEGRFVAVALLEYKFFDQRLGFIALEDTRGRWWDLKGQELLIEPRTAENAAAKLRSPHKASKGRVIDWSKF